MYTLSFVIRKIQVNIPTPLVVSREAALIVVDVQNDFCPGGALPASHGDEAVPVLNQYIKKFQKARALTVATRDWHPPNHSSFKPNGGTWPVHCIQDTHGAMFHPGLSLPLDVVIISKATDRSVDTYSGFQGTRLDEILREHKIRILWIGGLATDYCVKSTVLDALKSGLKVLFLDDASRGVDANRGDIRKAKDEMVNAGAQLITLMDLGD